MQTPTHALLALVFLARKGHPVRNRAVLIGALIPDAFIYICWVWLSLNGVSQDRIWNETYFEPSVQFWGALSNSVPIYLALAVTGWFTRKTTYGGLLLFFALAALTHMVTDFPVHAEDAHQHFWPFSTWRFHSPVSYWDAQHYGRITGLVETILGLGLVTILLRRFTLRATRIVLYFGFAYYLFAFLARLLFMTAIYVWYFLPLKL